MRHAVFTKEDDEQDQHTDDCVAASDATGVLTRLMDGLSIHEIAETVSEQAQEYADKGITVPLRRIVDEFLVTDQSYASVLPEERLAEVETAIRNMLTEEEKEEVFNGIVVPSLEEVFIEFLCSRLEGDQIELEDSMNGLPEEVQAIGANLESIPAFLAKNLGLPEEIARSPQQIKVLKAQIQQQAQQQQPQEAPNGQQPQQS